MGIVRYKEANDHYEDYKAIGGDLSKKEFFEQFHDELEGMWEGLFGITLYSDGKDLLFYFSVFIVVCL